MKIQTTFLDFVLREWLVIVSGAGLVLTTLCTKRLPVYSANEIEVLFILSMLFVVVNGLQRSGLMSKAAQSMEKGRTIPMKLVLITFLLSMLVTNDIALMVVIPLTLSINIARKDILVILEALAANAGSAMTPIGNPQNLYIYWSYDVPLITFMKTIAPFSLFFLVLLIVCSLAIDAKCASPEGPTHAIDKKAYIYGILLIIVILTVIRVFPVSIGLVVLLFSIAFDRAALRVDYSLLASFFFFFGIADNLKTILKSEVTHAGHIFLLSALVSQVISNVPATLLFADFTSNWQALLWGSNSGGFGGLFGSLANLIAYKLYVSHEDSNNVAIFTIRFISIGYIALFLATGLYFFLYQTNNWF